MNLEFLGWSLAPNGPPVGAKQFYQPPYAGAWQPSDLWVEAGVLHIATRLALTRSGLAIEVETASQGLGVEQVGAALRPKTATDRLFVRMGSSAGGEHRFSLGPVAYRNPTWTSYEFGERGVPRVELRAISRLIEDPSGADLTPLFVSGGAGRFEVDLAKEKVCLLPAALRAELRTFKPTDKTRVVAYRSRAQTLKFATIAAGTPLALRFELESATAAAPLNVAPSSASPKAGLEVFEADLVLTFAKGAQPYRPVLNAAALAPLPKTGARTRLKFHGMWDSRNRPEEWSCPVALPLAFRLGRLAPNEIWSSALVRPGELQGLLRLNGKSASGKVLPIHGMIPAAQVVPKEGQPAILVCSDLQGGAAELDQSIPNGEWRDTGMRLLQTRPWLRFQDAEFRHPRPGDAYPGAKPLTFVPNGSSGGLPAIAPLAWVQGMKTGVANAEVDSSYRKMALQTLKGRHETGLADESGATPTILRVLPTPGVLTKEPLGQKTSLSLLAHDKDLSLLAPGTAIACAPATPLKLKVKTPAQDGAFEYGVCWPTRANLPAQMAVVADDTWTDLLLGPIDASAPIGVARILEDKKRSDALPLAIVKVGRERGLEAILKEIGEQVPGGATYANARNRLVASIRKTDPDLLDANWVGVLVTQVALDFSQFTALEQTIPLGNGNSPRLEFLAVAPRQPPPGDTSDRRVSVSAAVAWESEKVTTPPKPAYPEPQNEVSFWPTKLDIRFRDSRMVAFRSEAVVEFRAFMGVGNTTAPNASNKQIAIIGSARRKDPKAENSPFEFRFAAEAKDPIQVYPVKQGPASAEDKSFLEKAFFRRLELVDAPPRDGETKRRAQIRIDGDVEFRKPKDLDLKLQGAFLSKIGGRLISFKDLGIDLLGSASLDPRFLQITWPSLKFNLDVPHVELFGNALRMKLHTFALNWTSGFNFPGFFDLGYGSNWDGSAPNLFFLGKVEFGNLPSFFARDFSNFSLEIGLGLNFNRNGAVLTGGSKFVIRGFGFDGLNFDLLSFLKVSIKKVAFGALPTSAGHSLEGSHLSVSGATVDVLGHNIFENASGSFYSLKDGGGNGFWAYFPPKPGGSFLFFFDWGFVGQNIDFHVDIAKTLLVPPPTNEPKDEADQIVQTGKVMATAWADGKIYPATTSAGRGWTFAAGITLMDGALKGRALIQDGGFAGLSVWGEELKKWFGYDFSFCGIYRKDITPGEDYFFISTTLPGMGIGTIRFTGGTIAIEIYTSGSFMLDFGFPWPGPDGGRLWRRTLGVIITPGQASAGLYIRKRETALVSDVPNETRKQLVLAAGFALQWGLGATFDSGPIFRVWVRVGVYVVMEGRATLIWSGNPASPSADLVALSVLGAGGILVEGEGAINWWVISIRVYVCASAEIRIQLEWAKGKPTTAQITAELYVSAYAEACIGGGCFKICRGIRVGLSIPVTHRLEF